VDPVVVPRLWPGETFVILGGGPSLTREDVAYCRGKARVIAINNGYQVAPWADVLFAADAKWWDWHAGVTDFAGLRYSVTSPPAQYGVTVLKRSSGPGLDLQPFSLRRGQNSGYMAINLAVHLGASRILLLGYDMQRGPKGEEHWHGDHPDKSKSSYSQFIARFESLAPAVLAVNVRVINCSPRTALPWFPRQPLREALPETASVAA
jgi:hypothetical protein